MKGSQCPLTMIQTRQLPNTSWNQYCLSHLLCFSLIMKKLWGHTHLHRCLVCDTRNQNFYTHTFSCVCCMVPETWRGILSPKVLNQDSWCRSKDSNRSPLELNLWNINLIYDWMVSKSQAYWSTHTDVLFAILYITFCGYHISFCQYNHDVAKLITLGVSHYVIL
jgi:hypothetical protein